MLLERSYNGKLRRNDIKEVSQITKCPRRTLQDMWRKAKIAGGLHGVLSKKPKNCGRKRIEFDPEALKQIEPRYKIFFIVLSIYSYKKVRCHII